MVLLSTLTVRAINIAVLSFCSLILIVILLNYPVFKLRDRASRIFYAKMLVSACMIIFYDISFIHGPEKLDSINIILRSLAYIGIYAVYVLYIAYIAEQINEKEDSRKVGDPVIYISITVGVIGSVVWMLSFFSPALSELNESTISYDRTFALGHIGAFILIAISVIMLLTYRKEMGNRETMVLMSMPILMLLATLLEPISQGIELRYPATVLEFLIVYTQHHMELEVRHEREETEGLRSRLNLTADRMKPHYLYNVLTTIYYLCETDPTRAQHAIGTFSEYMRSTLEAMDAQEPVPFSWEMHEIRNYLVLEKIRFADKLNVVYDIEYEDFLIPPLTVQPLVENAIRHGIGAKEDGGTIKIISRKLSDGGAQVRIKDDGVGFDVDNMVRKSGSPEGIEKLRERLKTEVGGDLMITSAPGKGTTALITIRSQNE